MTAGAGLGCVKPQTATRMSRNASTNSVSGKLGLIDGILSPILLLP